MSARVPLLERIEPTLGAIVRLLFVAVAVKIILGADPGITEEIKWKVPSFRTSEFFATLHLRAKTGIQVILHLGAKAGQSASGVSDPAGLLQWLGKDRALVAFRDTKDIRGRQRAFEELLRQWILNV